MRHVEAPSSDSPQAREWSRQRLTWDAINRFYKHISSADKVECFANGMSPYRSLAWALEHGPCWAAYEGHSQVPVGCWGWTQRGAVWSYWTELDRVQSRELLRHTPQMVSEMLMDSTAVGFPCLENYVWEDNTAAIKWLRASKCFDISLDRDIILSNKRFHHFRTKPLEVVRRYV